MDLNDAVRQVALAITDEGRHPRHHRKVLARHRAEWPTLWRALDQLRDAQRSAITARPMPPAGGHRLPVDQERYSIEEAAMAMGLVAILRAQEGDPRPLLDKCRAALQVVRMGSNADVDTWDAADLYEAVRAALGR